MAAQRLGVSQAYVSLLERGYRTVSTRMATKLVRLFQLPATALPLPAVTASLEPTNNQALAEDLGKLGYPGFAYLRTRRPLKNPTEVLLAALALTDLEARLAEALPWLLLEFSELDTHRAAARARLFNLQNRLGFVAALARLVAEANPRYEGRAAPLRELEQELRRSRLAKEETLGESLPSPAKRRWLEQNRLPEAEEWGLLTHWRPEFLRYVSS